MISFYYWRNERVPVRRCGGDSVKHRALPPYRSRIFAARAGPDDTRRRALFLAKAEHFIFHFQNGFRRHLSPGPLKSLILLCMPPTKPRNAHVGHYGAEAGQQPLVANVRDGDQQSRGRDAAANRRGKKQAAASSIIKPQAPVSLAQAPALVGIIYAGQARMRIDMRRLSTPLIACWISLAETPSSTSVLRGGSRICFVPDPFFPKKRLPFFSWSLANFLPKTIVPRRE